MSGNCRTSAFVLVAIAALHLITPTLANAQSQFWYLEPRSYFDPLRAEVRAAQTMISFGRSDGVRYYPREGGFFGWDIGLGFEIPIAGWESEPTRSADFSTRGAFGIGLWLPISFHMIGALDDADNSNPIINTDYRFSGMAKAHWQTCRNAALQFRVAVGHESTHLGDEFSLLAVRDPEFRRINVSHEDIEYGISYRHFREIGWFKETELLFRIQGIWPYSEGYYGTDLLEPEGGTVSVTSRKHQTGIGMQAASVSQWRPWVSVELRQRIVYRYDPCPGGCDETKLSVNAMIGLRTKGYNPTAAVTLDPFIRYYHGVNPAGQFRSDPDYTYYGMGLLARIGGR